MTSLTFYLEGVLLAIVGMVGLVGNVCALVVFSRNRRGQRNFHALMLSLAMFDMIYIIVNILLFSLPQFSDSYMRSGAYFLILPKALPFAQIGLTGSIYFTMAITVERYLTVCHPFYKLSHEWPAKYYVIPIFSFSFLYNIPKFFELKTGYPDSVANNATTNETSIMDHINNTSTISYMEAVDDVNVYNETEEFVNPYDYGILPTELRLNTHYYNIYCMWMNFILMGLGPYVILITLNTLMLLRLKEMQKERESEHGVQIVRNNSRRRFLSCAQPNSSTSSGQSGLSVVAGQNNNPVVMVGPAGQRTQDVALAKISLVIVFVFIVCHSLKWIPNIYELIQLGNAKMIWPNWVATITNISHLATTFNASVNFYIYFAKHYHTLMKRRQRSTDETSRMVTIATTTRIEYPNSAPPSGGGRFSMSHKNGGSRYFEDNFEEEKDILLTASTSFTLPSSRLTPEPVIPNGNMMTTQV